jgi:hypothetical protein
MSKLLRNDSKVSLEEGARLIRRRESRRLSEAEARRRQETMANLTRRSAVDVRRAQLAEAIYNLNPEVQPWNGDPFTLREALGRNAPRAWLAYAQADAVLALKTDG